MCSIIKRNKISALPRTWT